MKVAIVMPAYNEEARIGKTLEAYEKFFRKKKKEKLYAEVVVVINNTTDRTEEIVKRAGKKNKQIRYLNFKQGGKGFAIVEGFKDALSRDFDLIGFVDADLATPPEAFYDLIKKINGNDGIIGSRWLKESKVKTKQGILRIITSRGFNLLVRSILFLPYKDTQCGAKLFKRKVLESIIDEIGVSKWAFDIDLLLRIRKKGFKIIEIPTIWEDKRGSKLSLAIVPLQMFSAIIRLRLLFSPLKFVVKIYDKLPEKIKVHNW